MNRKELVTVIAKKSGLSQKDAGKALEAITFIKAKEIYPEREDWFTQKTDNGIVVNCVLVLFRLQGRDSFLDSGKIDIGLGNIRYFCCLAASAQ